MNVPAAPASSRTLLVNATLFDSATGTLKPGTSVRVEGDRIVQVSGSRIEAGGATVIDLAGRTLLPGLIDAHVHVTATTPSFFELSLQPQSLTTAMAKDILWGMLMRGFTTVRDAAGADAGLVKAVERGHFTGPRLYIAGRAITQTGGHGDVRPQFFQGNGTCICCGAVGLLGCVADGVDAVRKAVREELRNGARQIKVMAGGGISSPNDPLDGLQYSESELRAIVEEASNAHTYVMAHAYTPAQVIRAIRCGIRSIEHGNLIDAEAARVIAENGAFLVPTLATYDALYRNGTRLGWSDAMLAKLDMVRVQALDAIRHAREAGAKIGFGTDLLGEMHADESREFTLRAPAMPAAAILQSATVVNAELLGEVGRLGVVAPGAQADLVVVDGNPLDDLDLLQQQGRHLSLVMQAGRIHKHAVQ